MKLFFAIYFHIPCLLRSRQAPTPKGEFSPLRGKYWVGRPFRERARLLPKRAGVAELLHICAICDTHQTMISFAKHHRNYFKGDENFIPIIFCNFGIQFHNCIISSYDSKTSSSNPPLSGYTI
jgi:hypothetical protein